MFSIDYNKTSLSKYVKFFDKEYLGPLQRQAIAAKQEREAAQGDF
jgi:hypothetical protein